jgi:hypothetical protein
MSEENCRFLVEESAGNWQIKIVPVNEAEDWQSKNPQAILLRFAAVLKTGEGQYPCATKEEAIKKAKETGGEVRVIKPPDKIFASLPQKAVEVLYSSY